MTETKSDDIVYNIIGSEDSTDIDILVVVDKVPSDGQGLCEQYKKMLEPVFEKKSDRPLNVNVVMVKDDIIVWSYKGSADETNNCVFLTYNNHKDLQVHKPMVSKALPRDIIKKVFRGFRGIVGSMTRAYTIDDMKMKKEVKDDMSDNLSEKEKRTKMWTKFSNNNFRKAAKNSLSGNFGAKAKYLTTLDFTQLIFDPTETNQKIEIDNYKRVAFQLAQTIGLIEGIELFTKNQCIKMFPELKPFLRREKFTNDDLVGINKLCLKLASLMEQMIKDNPKIATMMEIGLVKPKKQKDKS